MTEFHLILDLRDFIHFRGLPAACVEEAGQECQERHCSGRLPGVDQQ